MQVVAAKPPGSLALGPSSTSDGCSSANASIAGRMRKSGVGSSMRETSFRAATRTSPD
jgi:hypothetical protein